LRIVPSLSKGGLVVLSPAAAESKDALKCAVLGGFCSHNQLDLAM